MAIKYVKIKKADGSFVVNPDGTEIKIPIGIDNANNTDVAATIALDDIKSLFGASESQN